MSKPLKHKKDKVPKITEEEYAAYVRALKEETSPEIKETATGKMQREEAKA